MSRAQEIRQRRLNERSTDSQEKWRIINDKANIMKEYVLDMLEKPTPNNSADEVILCKTDSGKIRIGRKWDQEFTEEIFEDEVMKN